ncbi:hypothetical protein ACLMJK_000598 [Lecanora helva]
MLDSEAYTLITTSSHHQGADDYVEANSGKAYNLNVYIQAALRRQYPELALTVTIDRNVPLLAFAFAGHATATLDIEDESIIRTRYFRPPHSLTESRSFAKYNYKWGSEYYILYVVQIGWNQMQYVFKEPAEGETIMSSNGKTDELVKMVGIWANPPPVPDDKWVYVYDRYWTRSKVLYEQVKNASWDDVILDWGMKREITGLMHKFFDSKGIYKNLGVPWKRGVIFHGPAGNGKTISIKALMNSLFRSDGLSIPSLYVKSAPGTYYIRSVFQQARFMSPCLLIFEDIDTVVTDSTRSYFFNEVDGLENNDGIFMVASTNHLDKLDPGLSSRPSRFDRKYLFPLPAEEERNLYCEYWRAKLKKQEVEIEFPKKICPAVAIITDGFSFAYMQEAFVATLLAIAGKRSEILDDEGAESVDRIAESAGDDGDKDLDDYELWREMKKTIKALRKDMDNKAEKPGSDEFETALALEREAQAPAAEFAAQESNPSADSSQAVRDGYEKKPESAPGKGPNLAQCVPICVRDMPLEAGHDELANGMEARVAGFAVEVDAQHVPMLNERGAGFVYKSK